MANNEHASRRPEGKPEFQINVVEFHLNIGFPTFVFGPMVQGAKAVERGLKRFLAEPETGVAAQAKPKRAAA